VIVAANGRDYVRSVSDVIRGPSRIDFGGPGASYALTHRLSSISATVARVSAASPADTAASISGFISLLAELLDMPIALHQLRK
jgi:hypothetical protein